MSSVWVIGSIAGAQIIHPAGVAHIENHGHHPADPANLPPPASRAIPRHLAGPNTGILTKKVLVPPASCSGISV